MSKKKSNKKLTLREYRSQLATLKRAGLISPHISPRSHKPTRHMMKQLATFRDVIAGEAKAVKTPSHKTALDFEGTNRVKFDRVVIKIMPGERARYSTAAKALLIDRKSSVPDITNLRQILMPRGANDLPKLPRDTSTRVYRYAVPFRRGGTIERIYFDTLKQLKRFMFDYDPKNGGRFQAWKGYIEIVELDRRENEDFRGRNDEKIGTSIDRRSRNASSRKAKAQPRDARGRFI